MSDFSCQECKKTFGSKQRLDYHTQKKVCTDKSHNCKFCPAKFTTANAMYRHMRIVCKMKKQTDVQKNEIYERLLRLEEENQKQKKENEKQKQEYERKLENMEKKLKKMNPQNATKNINNGTVNNGTINNGTINNGTINNITLVAYGSEDITKVGTTEIIKALKNGYHSTLKLTEAVHFNPKLPEYHNVYISNMRDKYAMVYDGEVWNLIMKDELINKLYDNKKNYIEDNMDNFVGSLSVSQKNALVRWLDIDDDDDKRILDIKERIKLLLYNSKHIPIDTANSIEMNRRTDLSEQVADV